MAGEVQRGHAIGALVLGVLEMVFGLIIIICSFVLGSKINASASLTPYWAGIPYIIPGILGVVVGVTKNFCSMVAFMVLNIICFIIDGIAAILIAIVISLYATVAAEFSSKCTSGYKSCICTVNGKSHSFAVDSCSTLEAIAALLWSIVVFAALCAIVTLSASILGCVSVCCTPRDRPGAVIVQQPVIMQPQQQYPPAYDQQGYPTKT